MEYITLDASGITAPLYGSTNMITSDSNIQRRTEQDAATITGHFGNSAYPNKVQSTCAIYAMNQGQAQKATKKRMKNALQNGLMSGINRKNAGFN